MQFPFNIMLSFVCFSKVVYSVQVFRLKFCSGFSYSAHLILLDLIILFNEEYELWNFSMCRFFHASVSLSLAPNYSKMSGF